VFGYVGAVLEWVHRGTRVAALCAGLTVLMGGRPGDAAGQISPGKVDEKPIGAGTEAANPASGDSPAEPPGEAVHPGIVGPSTCPQPAAVWAELRTLMPLDRLDALFGQQGSGGRARVEIFDLGIPYRIVAAGRVREYRDEARDCAARARVAAVFVALAIDLAEASTAKAAAPDVARPLPPPAAPLPVSAASAQAAASAAPEAVVGRAAAVRLQLGATVDASTDSGNRVAEPGLALRVSVGRGRWTFAGGASALLPVDVEVGGVRLRQYRAPADAGARLVLSGARRLEPYVELGVGATVISERGVELASAQTRTTVELGVRGAFGVSLETASRFAPFFAIHAQVIPAPPTIFALPRRDVGRTPLLWLGLTAGASLDVM